MDTVSFIDIICYRLHVELVYNRRLRIGRIMEISSQGQWRRQLTRGGGCTRCSGTHKTRWPRFFQQLENCASHSARVYLPQWNDICGHWMRVSGLLISPKCICGRGSLQRSPRPRSWWGGDSRCPLPRTLLLRPPNSAFLGPFGLKSAPPSHIPGYATVQGVPFRFYFSSYPTRAIRRVGLPLARFQVCADFSAIWA